MAKKTKENLQPEPSVMARVEGPNVILRADDGTFVRVPIAGAAPKEEKTEPLPKYIFIELLRLFRLGVDDLDRVAKLLNFDRDKVTAKYAASLREYAMIDLSDAIVKRLEEAGDFCEHDQAFKPLALTGCYPDKILAMRKQRPELFRNIPNATYIKQLKGQGKKDAEIAKALQFDEKDFQRWLEDHASLLAQL